MNLRPATPADETFILSVRNDPDTRANAPTDLVRDAWWYEKLLKDPYCKTYAAEAGTSPVPIGYGILKLYTPSVAEVSIALAKSFRGMGYGTSLIDALMAEGQTHGIQRFLSTVRGGNVASLKAFLNLGYSPTKWVYLECHRP